MPTTTPQTSEFEAQAVKLFEPGIARDGFDLATAADLFLRAAEVLLKEDRDARAADCILRAVAAFIGLRDFKAARDYAAPLFDVLDDRRGYFFLASILFDYGLDEGLDLFDMLTEKGFAWCENVYMLRYCMPDYGDGGIPSDDFDRERFEQFAGGLRRYCDQNTADYDDAVAALRYIDYLRLHDDFFATDTYAALEEAASRGSFLSSYYLSLIFRSEAEKVNAAWNGKLGPQHWAKILGCLRPCLRLGYRPAIVNAEQCCRFFSYDEKAQEYYKSATEAFACSGLLGI